MKHILAIYHPEIPAFLLEFADTPPMQRLKSVGMNCGCEYTNFPRFRNLRPYSRFDHSLGAALIVWHFTLSMEQSLAALFHDITTPVFAHVVDFLRGDHLKQESTEAGVEACIAGSEEICRLLKRYEIPVEAVVDYHRYPIADNDSPALSADRLEYTIGNLYNYGFASLDEIRRFYGDLTVGADEKGAPELMFRSREVAAAFTEAALKNAYVYVADEDRFAMESLARLLHRAIERQILAEKDLWTTEAEVIEKLQKNRTCGEAWQRYQSYSRILRSTERPETEEWLQVDAKKRWIDPLAAGVGRVSEWNGKVRRQMETFCAQDFCYWLNAQ